MSKKLKSTLIAIALATAGTVTAATMPPIPAKVTVEGRIDANGNLSMCWDGELPVVAVGDFGPNTGKLYYQPLKGNPPPVYKGCAPLIGGSGSYTLYANKSPQNADTREGLLIDYHGNDKVVLGPKVCRKGNATGASLQVTANPTTDKRCAGVK